MAIRSRSDLSEAGVPKSVGQSGSARFSFNRSGPGLQPDTTARTSPQRTVKGSRPDLQHEMRPTVLGALRGDVGDMSQR